MKIEIITTPNKMLKETGFGSLEACQSVMQSIHKIGHEVSLNICRTKADLLTVVNKKPALVLLAVKYLSIENGDDIWLAEYFERQNINFAGSLKDALKFDSDKVSAKLFLRSQGVKTAKFFTAIPGQFTCESELPVNFPLFLKPVDAANGNGIDDFSLVNNYAEYRRKLLSLYEIFKQPVLVEEYLSGQEFTVAIIKTQSKGLTTSIIEVIPPESSNGLRILGEKAKKEDTETFRKTESSELTSKVRKLAVNVFKLLGVRDFARIDIKMNAVGECFFMEANLVPGLTAGTSYFPKAMKIAHGLGYDSVIRMLIEGGVSRAPSTLIPMKDFYIPETILHVTRSRRFLNRCTQLIGWR